MDADKLSEVDKDFLEQCEVEFKDRYTDNDEDYMKVFNAEPLTPPIMENWSVGQDFGRRNNFRNKKPRYSYNHSDNRNRHSDHGRDSANHGRGYQDRSYEERGNHDRRYSNRGYQDRREYSKMGRHE